MQASPVPTELKEKVRDFWNSDPCGTRYLEDADNFAAHARARYALEPYIFRFAQFPSAAGARVLEIGVGMGADYLEWLKAGALATGIDLSPSSADQARRRCELAGYKPDLQVSDAENLSFSNDTFDLVYSYGVMHHSVDVQRCVNEAWRVLKPGGEARIMLYHHPSLTGFMLWLRFGVLRNKSLRQTVYERLESPGTQSFSRAEVREMMKDFENIRMEQVFSPGDLLLHTPSSRFNGFLYRMAWSLYPRFIARLLCRRMGLFLLISARKPA
ncbi:MAG: class I SAM-dependent methyltransferase [Candidatus Sulfotelmatobacter sp.]|jgi:ubiquinone/menaquinone biosynthesis C-methylase UbiE